MTKGSVLIYSFLLLLYAYFCYLMVQIVMQYIPYDTDTAFLVIKQDEIGLLHYRFVFFIHVYTSLFVLPAGFIQFSTFIQKNYKWLHRLSGRIYVFMVLFLVAPSGMVMAFYANGGISSQIAFALLSLLWFYSTLKGYTSARQKKFRQHRAWMIRSFALTLSAITLREWKDILVYLFHPPPMDVYRIVAWLGWTLNLVIAEIIIFKSNKK